jgi:hypothetical protein
MALALVFYFFLILPGLLIAAIGWRLSRRTKKSSLRIIIRAGLISVAIAPTSYGHAGTVPAIWAVFVPPARTIDWAAIIALSSCWFMALVVLILLRWMKPGLQI